MSVRGAVAGGAGTTTPPCVAGWVAVRWLVRLGRPPPAWLSALRFDRHAGDLGQGQLSIMIRSRSEVLEGLTATQGISGRASSAS